jgi:hypothetical protein
MPKLIKLFRNKKIPSSLPAPNIKRSSGIFRRSSNANSRTPWSSKQNNKNKTSSVIDDVEKQLEIHPAITFSLSDEDEGSDCLPSPLSDIENQLDEHFEEHTTSDVVCPPADGVENSTFSSFVRSTSGTTTEQVSVGLDDDSKTMTFTHLEIMRNELNHMMDVATKHKEIVQLTLSNEKLMVDHANELALKDKEIQKLQNALDMVEGALAQTRDDLVRANDEQTRIIEMLMKTQYELHELKHQSWFTPLVGYFSGSHS